MERRQRNFLKCEELYTEAIKACTEETYAVFFYIHFARMVGRVYESPRRAREIFSEGIEKYPHQRDLWMAFIQFEKMKGGDDVEERVAAAYDHAIHHTQELSPVDKMALLADWIEYCNDEGRNMYRLRNLSNEYRETFMGYETSTATTGSSSTSTVVATTPVVGVKRSLETDGSDQPASKVARSDYYGSASSSTDASATADYSGYYGGWYDYSGAYQGAGFAGSYGTGYAQDGGAYDPGAETTY